MICGRCNWLRGDGCTCPDEVTARQRQIEVEIRHRTAVDTALQRERWRTWRERNAS